MQKGCDVKYQLPIDLSNDALLQLQRRSRERNLPVDELVRNLLEDFVKDAMKRTRKHIPETGTESIGTARG